MFGNQSKLRTVLTIIFLISLVALLLQLFYLLWRLRLRRRRNPTTYNGSSDNDHHQLSQSSTSKQQLLHFFFCSKTNLSRVEPNSTPSPDSTVTSPESTQFSSEMIDDVLKLYTMRGPSRVLFTIKEEEREDLESAERSVCSSAEKEKKTKRTMSLRECFEVGKDPLPQEVAVAIDDHMGGRDNTTPFSTPCASPLYFTPSATPTRQIADGVCSV